MKRKSIALLLALMMCLALLSACGGNGTTDTKEPPASENTSIPAGQEPADGKEEQPTQKPEQEEPEESEEPKQDEPEESEEPTQEDHEGTKLLALLKEEWNGFVPTYNFSEENNSLRGNNVWMSDGVIYLLTKGNLYSYDIAPKSLSLKNENPFVPERPSFVSVPDELRLRLARNGIVYAYYYVYGYQTEQNWIMTFDYNGAFQKISEQDEVVNYCMGAGDKGFLYMNGNIGGTSFCLYSYDLEKLAEFSSPTYEVEVHGEAETNTVVLGDVSPINGTFYGHGRIEDTKVWYRLNTDTYEWEEAEAPWEPTITLSDFCGKYVVKGSTIYDIFTGEKIFESRELPQPYQYFGGDKYLGRRSNADKHWEYCWVDLTNMSVSDPLPFPEKASDLTILTDTYCVYSDKYGWFLWNYNDGTEETILKFDS